MSYMKDGKLINTSKKIQDMLVYPVTHNLVDFFWGDGWENHARFKWSRDSWELWEKSSNLPKNFINALESYRKGE